MHTKTKSPLFCLGDYQCSLSLSQSTIKKSKLYHVYTMKLARRAHDECWTSQLHSLNEVLRRHFCSFSISLVIGDAQCTTNFRVRLNKGHCVIFGRPLRSSLWYDMSACLSVTQTVGLTGKVIARLIIPMWRLLACTQFQRPIARGTFSNLWLNKNGVKICIFNQ